MLLCPFALDDHRSRIKFDPLPSFDCRLIVFTRFAAFVRISLYFSHYFLNFFLCIPQSCLAKFDQKGSPFYLPCQHININIFCFYLTDYLLQLRQSLGVSRLLALAHGSASSFVFPQC